MKKIRRILSFCLCLLVICSASFGNVSAADGFVDYAYTTNVKSITANTNVTQGDENQSISLNITLQSKDSKNTISTNQKFKLQSNLHEIYTSGSYGVEIPMIDGNNNRVGTAIINENDGTIDITYTGLDSSKYVMDLTLITPANFTVKDLGATKDKPVTKDIIAGSNNKTLTVTINASDNQPDPNPPANDDPEIKKGDYGWSRNQNSNKLSGALSYQGGRNNFVNMYKDAGQSDKWPNGLIQSPNETVGIFELEASDIGVRLKEPVLAAPVLEVFRSTGPKDATGNHRNK